MSDESDVFRVNGISYLHLPALDPGVSAEFYRNVFGWTIRGGGDHPSFADGSGHVMGAWVRDRPVADASGVLPYIYVDDVRETLEQVGANEGVVVKAPYVEGDLLVATFADPAGNEIGVWQRRQLGERLDRLR